MEAVRRFEKLIDNYPAQLPICKQSKCDAIWHLLLAHEHVLLNRHDNNTSVSSLSDSEDLKKALKHALDWVYKYCPDSAKLENSTFSHKVFSEALDLLILGSAYQPIFCMFSMLNNHRNLVTAQLEKSNILHFEYDSTQLRFEALHFLTAELQTKLAIANVDSNKDLTNEYQSAIGNIIDRGELVDGRALKYEFSKAEYTSINAFITGDIAGWSFRLPDNWSFQGISAIEFRKCFNALRTLSLIDTVVHRHFLREYKDGSGAYPIFDSVIWHGAISDMISHICSYDIDCDRSKVNDIFKLLTYNPNVSKPDPALQPIIPCNEAIHIAPQLLLSSSFERNLIALLAREHKEDYDRTTHTFEPAILIELEKAFLGRGFIVKTRAKIPGNSNLADIDLLAYEPTLKKLTIAEVKWVIAPGEPYEQLSRADAEEKAIRNQLVPLVDYANENKSVLLNIIDVQTANINEVSLCSCLIMRGFCGMNHELSEIYPTIDADLLLNEMKSSRSNELLLTWITNKVFLPDLGRDYKLHNRVIEFGPYKISIDGANLVT